MKRSVIAIPALLTILTLQVHGQVAGADTASSASLAFAADATVQPNPTLVERHLRYKIRKGDTFDLDFPLSPEFNQTLAVQPDGYVSLKAAGSMVVEGQTVPQLEESIKRAYAKVLHDPIVSISLRDFDKPFFIAAGQVSKPGKYDLRGDITVTQAVAIAGGFNQNAKHSQVVLFRPAADGHYEATVLNIKKLLASHNLSEDVCLRPGDMLYVPQSAYSHIRPFLPSSVVGAYYNPAFN